MRESLKKEVLRHYHAARNSKSRHCFRYMGIRLTTVPEYAEAGVPPRPGSELLQCRLTSHRHQQDAQ